MNQQLLNYIQELSKKDKKTLSQKALKVAEESGELAKAVLPFDSAYATRHRFVDKTKILEEVCDTILASISIAYDLDFSHEEIEEMMYTKSERWQELQTSEDAIEFPLPYEIHITVSAKEGEIDNEFIEHFKASCQSLDVKPISLDLENNSGESIKDVMTSSRFIGDNRSVYEEVQRIKNGLEYRKFKVVREKVETVPWHPGSPKKSGDKMPKNCYFEAHIGCIISEEQKELLNFITKSHNAHLSRNAFKKLEDGKFVNMVTLRNYGGNKHDFDCDVKNLSSKLKSHKISFEKIITEFCIYDTKVSHDYLWLQ